MLLIRQLRAQIIFSHTPYMVKAVGISAPDFRPTEPGFAMTVHKAQGQTMTKVALDLAGCSRTEQPYMMVSRSTSRQGLFILREFNFGKMYPSGIPKIFVKSSCD